MNTVRSSEDTSTNYSDAVPPGGCSIEDKNVDDDLWPEEAVLLNASQNIHEVISFFEEEDEEQERLLLATLFGVESNNVDLATAPHTEQQLKKSKVKNKPLVICKICKSALQTLDGYIRHKMSHAMNGELTCYCLIVKLRNSRT